MQINKNNIINEKDITEIEKDNKLLITFLGGIREIGRNCTAYEYNNKIYIVDCGIIFRGSLNVGVNVALPNIDYLKDNIDKIQSIFITHGHEDHIGGISYLFKALNKTFPIYLGKFPGEIIKYNFINSKDDLLIEAVKQIFFIRNNYTVHAGENIQFKFVSVTHSTPDSYYIFINTPTDNILHTGDWKFDLTPISTKTDFFNIVKAASYKGVDLVVTDSTRCELDGFSGSEKDVVSKFDDTFEKHRDKRIIISIFGSNADRVIKLIQLSQKYNRKVFLSGWSIIKCVNAAIKAGLIRERNVFLNIDSIAKFKPIECLILCTGAQGEVEASLSKMALGEKKHIKMNENDLVIFSANIIPGNKSNTMNLIEQLLDQNVTVFHPSLSNEHSGFHVSGHGMRKDILMMLNLVQPKNFIPVHGELQHLLCNIKNAKDFGISKENIFLPQNNKQFTIYKSIVREVGLLHSVEKSVDNFGEYIGNDTIKHRTNCAKFGILNIKLSIVKNSFELKELDLIYVSKYMSDMTVLIEKTIQKCLQQFNTSVDEEQIKITIIQEISKLKKDLTDKKFPSINLKIV